MTTVISKNKKFEDDCARYKKFISECSDPVIKNKAESLLNQFVAQAKELDYFFHNVVVSDVKIYMPQHHGHRQRLREIRYQLESLSNQA